MVVQLRSIPSYVSNARKVMAQASLDRNTPVSRATPRIGEERGRLCRARAGDTVSTMLRIAIICLSAVLAASAQTPLRRTVRAYGEASVSVRPDQAKLSASVVTQATTGQEAATANAARVTALIEALRAVLGANADIRTLSYSLTPNYTFPRDSPPVLTNFTATNTLEITVPDLGIVGRVIDTAISAGATRVDSLRLSVKDDEPPRAQALRLAGQKARAKAESIAQGLGLRIGGVIAAEEGYSARPLVIDTRLTPAPAAVTPIEAGTLEIRATVTVDFEVAP